MSLMLKAVRNSPSYTGQRPQKPISAITAAMPAMANARIS